MNILVPLVHTLDRPIHALDRLFHALSTVRSEIVHKLCLKISGYSRLVLFKNLWTYWIKWCFLAMDILNPCCSTLPLLDRSQDSRLFLFSKDLSRIGLWRTGYIIIIIYIESIYTKPHGEFRIGSFKYCHARLTQRYGKSTMNRSIIPRKPMDLLLRSSLW